MTQPIETPPLWWQRGVVYQIYPRSFCDTTGDGIGDLRGIIHKIDYLSDTLGADAIWLSPFYPSPMADFGYDVSNYTDVHPMFGSLANFDQLVAEAHRRDIAIIIDFVPNHSSDQHPWFVESRSARDSPKRNWYVWADPKPDGSPPNNWLAHFGGGAWEWDENTRQYYLHSFLKEQPDLNWRNPEVETAMLDAMRFWLDREVDGFRLDVPLRIMKDPELRDNPPNPNLEAVRSEYQYDTQLHINDHAHPDVHEAFRKIRRLLDEYGNERPRVAIGEIQEFHWPIWASYFGKQLDEIHLPFNFALLYSPWTAEAFRTIVESVEAHVPIGGWPNYVLGNHDVHRIASRVGPARARLAMMLLLTLRGTPTMYYGEEIGMHDVEIPPDRVHDPFEINVPNLGLGRDPERTPMQWDGGPNAGFCGPGVQPWLPLSADYVHINVSTELEDDGSFLTLTRRLLAVRREWEALHVGRYQTVVDAPQDCFVYVREQGDRRILVALNFADQDCSISSLSGKVLLSTHLDREEEVASRGLTLRPHEGCIVDCR